MLLPKGTYLYRDALDLYSMLIKKCSARLHVILSKFYRHTRCTSRRPGGVKGPAKLPVQVGMEANSIEVLSEEDHCILLSTLAQWYTVSFL